MTTHLTYGGPMWAPDDVVQEPDDVADRLVAGDRDALAEAYRRWAPLVHTIAVRGVQDAHEAEDVTQQVFVAAWNGRHTLRPGPDAVPRWLVGIARHKVADVRTQRWRARRNLQAVGSVTRLEDVRHDEEVTSRVVVAHELELLGEPRGTVLRLAVVEGRTAAEVADELGLPLGTVKSHVRRGLLQLRSRLKEV